MVDTKDWYWVAEHRIWYWGVEEADLDTNDIEIDLPFAGVWIRPNSKTALMLALKGVGLQKTRGKTLWHI